MLVETDLWKIRLTSFSTRHQKIFGHGFISKENQSFEKCKQLLTIVFQCSFNAIVDGQQGFTGWAVSNFIYRSFYLIWWNALSKKLHNTILTSIQSVWSYGLDYVNGYDLFANGKFFEPIFESVCVGWFYSDLKVILQLNGAAQQWIYITGILRLHDAESFCLFFFWLAQRVLIELYLKLKVLITQLQFNYI